MVAMTDDADPELALDTGAKEAMVQLLANPTRLLIVDALRKRQTKAPGRPRTLETSRTTSTDSVGGSPPRRTRDTV